MGAPDLINTAAQYGIPALVAGFIGSFLRGLLNGTTAQEKDLRDALVDRVDTLERRMKEVEDANMKLRKEVEQQQKRFFWLLNDRERIRRERDSLRDEINRLLIRLGEVIRTWTTDPPDQI